ncbi:MAG: hypothetical protein H3C34_15695 [Caldilineaceae bacterium]|nr:hypothetical protein [Caldilineaceae bacterium]
MEPIEIDGIHTQIPQALVQIKGDLRRGQARDVHGGQLRMSALGRYYDIRAVSTLPEPATDCLFAAALLPRQPVGIHLGRIKEIPTLRHIGIEQLKRSRLVNAIAEQAGT